MSLLFQPRLLTSPTRCLPRFWCELDLLTSRLLTTLVNIVCCSKTRSSPDWLCAKLSIGHRRTYEARYSLKMLVEWFQIRILNSTLLLKGYDQYTRRCRPVDDHSKRRILVSWYILNNFHGTLNQTIGMWVVRAWCGVLEFIALREFGKTLGKNYGPLSLTTSTGIPRLERCIYALLQREMK